MVDLKESRAKIDAIDKQITDLFVQRMGVSADVAEYKKAHGMQITVRERELAILDERAAQAGEEMGPYVRELYEQIFIISKKLQAERNK